MIENNTQLFAATISVIISSRVCNYKTFLEYVYVQTVCSHTYMCARIHMRTYMFNDSTFIHQLIAR